MRSRWRSLRESLRTGFWAVPAACVTAAIVLALVLVRVDRSLQGDLTYTFGAGPDGAREVLGAITTAMITFTGLVFSITIVVLQLTSSQFSPRVLRTFLRDRQTQVSLGVFVSTFVYAVMVLRTVDSTDASTFVPAVATTTGVALLLLSVAVFVSYIHHVATSIQVTSIVAAIGDETRRTIDRRYPPGTGAPPDDGVALPPDGLPAAVLASPTTGVLTSRDDARLVALAASADVVLRSRVALGDFVPEGAPLLEVLGDAQQLDDGAVLAALVVRRDRTLDEDVAFGFRQLVDIAERALSPGVNDPTTAVQALDQLHDLLRRLATRPLRSGVHTDGEGRVRLVVPPERFEDYLALALDEVEQYGEDALPVQHRVRALLDDLRSAAIAEHRAAVEDRSRR